MISDIPLREAMIRPLHGRVAVAPILALILALILGVGCDSGTPESARSAYPSAPAAAEVPAGEAPLIALPEPGVVTLEVVGDRITLRANGVPARELLERLRDHLRFEIQISRGVVLPRAVTVLLADSDVDDALEQILRGLPYALFYAIDPDDQHHLLSRVQVGQPETGEDTVAALTPLEALEERRAFVIARRAKPHPSPEERRESYQRNQDTWYDDLDDPDPGARAYAVDSIYLDEHTFPILTDLLSNDPDPRVRAAAAGTLADDLDNPSAADALLIALEDSSSEVVIEALDALEDVGDASNIADIQPLLLHRDSEVREAAIEAIEWLED